jgi:hypothetical protein|tara:strand:+ start:1864 stop:2145 length:282 start_codon:yes stop_codon:yes gene_type:complete
MAFMIPAYDSSDFVAVENSAGEWTFVPLGYEDLQPGETIAAQFSGKVFVRLSAPGYLDCTEWSGPYDSEAEAGDFIEETYDVDRDTGEDLPEF